MKFLKFKYKILKYNKLIMVITIIIISVIISYFSQDILRLRALENPSLLGVYGTLLGALIGGTFTLIGSVWVNNRHIKAQTNIKRKNLIYRPLYDEIVEIHNIILVENPFPNYVVFEKRQQTMTRHPQYTAWQRIQNDTRILQTPDILRNQLNKLYASIEDYLKNRYVVNEVIKGTLNKILIEEINLSCPITNIGDVISHDILLDNNKNFFVDKSLFFNEEDIKEFTQEKLELVNIKIYEECSQLKEVVKIKQLYNKWLQEQENTIELLSILIKTINLKYEKIK
jgi:protein-S-isoprenylcysteine O-methyltransferase Ste14